MEPFHRETNPSPIVSNQKRKQVISVMMGWLDIVPASIEHILITHQDTDHVGALEKDSEQLFRNATIYLSEIENRYLTGEKRRRVIHGLYKLPLFKTDNRRVLLRDGQILNIGGIKIECILCPGHTWGHMVYLIDDEYLFTGDTIWFGAIGDGDKSLAFANAFIDSMKSLNPKTISRQFYSDYITPLDDDIHADGTAVHIVYALKMGEKYGKRYRRHFRDPDIHAFDMKHEVWLYDDTWRRPVLEMIDACMG